MTMLRLSILLSMSAVLFLSGCGGYGRDNSEEALKSMTGEDELKETVPVTGVVTVDGTPAVDVDMFAYTKESGMKPAAECTTGADGTYQWTTYKKGDGLVPGDYRIGFKKESGAKGNKSGDDELGGKYKNPMENDFSLTVVSGTPQTDVNYDLTTN